LVTVSQLSSLLGVSGVSIRRDLRVLQAAGLLEARTGKIMVKSAREVSLWRITPSSVWSRSLGFATSVKSVI
jgi:DeoR/GlpR family transcriptional regulator of sugar metabolism